MSVPLIDTAAFSALTIAALHWFPWQRLLGRKLPRLIAYGLGVAVILGAPSLAYWRNAPLAGAQVFALFWASALAAGAATLIAWAIDALLEASALAADLEDARNERAQRVD